MGIFTHMTKLQKIILEEIEKKGLNKTTFARDAGLELTYIKDILSGKSKFPRMDKLQKLASYLRRPVSDFFENEEGGIKCENYIPLREREAVINSNQRLTYTGAVLIAKEALEQCNVNPEMEEVEALASRMCDVAAREGTSIVNLNLAIWLIEIMKKKKE